MSRSIPQRKAASVLPEPVGARISAWSPAAIAGQPWACASVGWGKVVSNQARTGGENGASECTGSTTEPYGGGVTTRPAHHAELRVDVGAIGPITNQHSS